ncbi:hypothetical protein CcaverHIS002_0602570 [Cutaneotrichosporon cavernicola]|uniref:ER membrane protein complex subunit 4 n=1 Tax=Cutaneotrichosporon cavernicola TaxID=279322 RepID=A0AA48L8C1_9TREE|nr:uncharacterized protein CcaverHIS019_0602050 [Cutaneotrichosporon cavernicola]BEI85970.1 hypothetical protein CcaverHIS002_0602570 [Cutaneotrichosporon cavernicola]BEI93746.1 hypothetical protein CcaverHIS019_0602050 [Cutaneotrichosporon cavernicola]BEJ01524.1 hypothetical protein CcaverHIS631_0602060 [Cutaneotrichosporon cavernicola]
MVKLDYTTSGVRVPNPPGFVGATRETSKRDAASTERQSNELKLKRAWEMAFAPAKSLPMQAIMLYFSGSGVQIFSLGMIFMLVTGPISAVASILRAFEPFRTVRPDGELTYAQLIPPMVTYTLCQGVVFALGLYKCWTMGILPSGPADWLQFETRPAWPEWSAVRALILGEV